VDRDQRDATAAVMPEEQRMGALVRDVRAVARGDLRIRRLVLAREHQVLGRADARHLELREMRLLERRRQRVGALGSIEQTAFAPARDGARDFFRDTRELRHAPHQRARLPRGCEQQIGGDGGLLRSRIRAGRESVRGCAALRERLP
jgi:hypothetical protein